MRKLSSKELFNGIFVQLPYPLGSIPSKEIVYQILIKNGEYFYKVKDSNWEINGEMVKDNWCETELTKSLNREHKLTQLGII